MAKKKSILDIFSQISSEHEACRPDLCLRLWNHLNKPLDKVSHEALEKENDEETESEKIPKEITYTLGRLVQGLGSPRAHIRKCYFSTLVSILSNCGRSFGAVTLTYFKSIIDKHLSKFESKGEKGEILTGRILAYGVAFRSKIFLNSSVEVQQDVIVDMLTKCKERSYLPLLAYTFLVDFLHTIDESTFKTVIWPVLVTEVLVNWESQTFETLNCLLEVHNKYPHLFRKKMILSALHSHEILHEETIGNVVNMLTNVNWEPRLRHPLYKTICVALAQEDNSKLLTLFWTDVENILYNSPTRIQQLAILNIFSCLVQQLRLEKIMDLLTQNFVNYLINSCRLTVTKADKLTSSGKTALQLVISRTTENSEESVSAFVYQILSRLLFESGHLLVDKITGLKLVFPCIAKLNAEEVKLMAANCENVILLNKKNTVRWTFKDRCYATQLLARLISHPQSQDMNWKIKHLKFMLKNSLFVSGSEDGGHVSNELAGVLKNSFFTALGHQLSHLENHRMMLISLVYYIDNMLENGKRELRAPLADEVLECWKKTMNKIQRIDLKINETAERKTVMYVFHTLFLQMALHLFVDAGVARDILKELNKCYKKEKRQFDVVKCEEQRQQDHSEDPEPKWIDIAVELFLSLLSRDTFLLRQLISRIFPHFCPYLTAQASSQILEVLNPASKNILSDGFEESDADGSDVNEEEDNVNVMEVDDDYDESDSNIEEDEDFEENAVDKTRRAVRDALGIAGSVTDTESVDLDDMDEEEGKRLDLALSEAFKSTHKKPQNKNKKQSAGDKALTNFRIRVIDLVDIYLDNDPPLALVLDTIPMLFSLLEFCIKDSHQKPLETRIRSTIKKIGNLKKCKNVDEVEVNNVVEILRNLMNKGDRSAPIFLDLSLSMSECSAFLLRMGIQISSDKKGKKTENALCDVFVGALKDFFLKRDCLLPLNLFENILLKIGWIGNIKLCEHIVSNAFDSSVRGFRRNQALTLLSCFYKNTRLISTLKETENEDYASLEESIINHTINLLNSLKNDDSHKLKHNFVSELFSLLYTIRSSKFCMEVQKWKNLAHLLQSFSNNGSFGLNFPRKYITKLCSLLKIQISFKPIDSRKRKREEENTERSKVIVKNGNINDSDYDEIDESTQEVKRENTVNKTVIKKKKSKRKTKEHFDSKKLRNETLANDVEVFNFSKTGNLKI